MKSLSDPFGSMDSSPFGGGMRTQALPTPTYSLEFDAKGNVTKGLFDWAQGAGGGGYRQMMQLAGDPALTKPFLQNPWVYACAMAIAKATRTIPTAMRDPDTKKRIEERSDVLALFRRPNPVMSQAKLWTTVSLHLLLFGESFLFLTKSKTVNGRRVMLPIGEGELAEEIWPVAGPVVQPVMDEMTQLPKAWRIDGGQKPIEYPAHAVAQINEVDPDNPLRGVGPMQAAWRTAAKEFTLDRFDDALLKNGGSPGGTLSFKGNLSESMLRLAQAQWNANNNTTEGHRKTAVLPMGAEYKQFGFNPQEMEFKDLRVWNREVVMSVFGVTRIILGLTDGVNYAGAIEARRIFYEATVLPHGEFIASEITYKLVSRLKTNERDREFYFNSENLPALREGKDARFDRLIKLFNQTGRSFNDAARLAGVDDVVVTDGDRMFLPASMAPLPEEKAKYDAQVAAAKPAPSVGAKDLDTTAEKDADSPPVVASDDAAAKLRANASAMLEATLKPHDEAIAKKLKRVYRDYLLAVRSRLKKVAGVEAKEVSAFEKMILTEAEVRELLGIVEAAFEAEIRAAVGTPFGVVFDAAARDAAIKVGSSGVFLTHANPAALQFLADKGVALAEGTMTTLATEVQHAILRTLASAPDNVTSVADAIRVKLDELVDQVETMIDALPARAMNIARTETTSIYGYAHDRSNALAEVDQEWSTSGDDHVRAAHQELNGLVRAPGEEFGFGLRYPGDPQAGAAMVVNCRCALIPRTRTNQ